MSSIPLRLSRSLRPLGVPRTIFARTMATASTESTTEGTTESITFTLPESSFKTFEPVKTDGTRESVEGPSLEVTSTRDELLHIFKQMTLIRRMETAADMSYKQKLIRGFCHLSSGQEAVAVGMEAAITPEDAIITAYRCHGYALTRGQTVHGIMAELFAKSTGVSKGKGGSMHMFARNFYGGNGIVGAQVPVGAGIAFTQQYLNTGNATFILYGDGAANQGQVFEAFNMAKLWNLPAVFVCENNLYGMGTSAARSSALASYYMRGQYIAGLQVNGMDVLAVKNACAWAKDWVSADKGPLVLEMVTYRYGGHSMSDPGTTYRTREEIQRMRSTSDPITGLRQGLMDRNIASEAELKAIDKEARAVVEEAVEQSKKDPFPDPADLFADMYKRGSEPYLIRGREREEHAYFPRDKR